MNQKKRYKALKALETTSTKACSACLPNVLRNAAKYLETQ